MSTNASRVAPPEGRKVPHAKQREPVVWLTLMIPVSISNRLVRVVELTNERRPPDRRYVSKTSFAIAALGDALDEAEKGMGIT